jgi:hypothetical protein
MRLEATLTQKKFLKRQKNFLGDAHNMHQGRARHISWVGMHEGLENRPNPDQ